MTDSQPHIRKPTSKQIDFLEKLAMRTGTSFSWPKTSGQAHLEINRLLTLSPSSNADRRHEARQVSEDLARSGGDAAAIRPDEIGGYGASATMLTSGHDREVKVLMDQIRELHPRRADNDVCREAYSSCCEELRDLSPLAFRRMMGELGGNAS
jgi:hypothetical protein